MNDPYARARLLLSQHRYDMAEVELRMQLTQNPQDADGHALLSLCLLHDSKRMVEATEQAQRSVGLAPDESIGHYALSVSYLQRNRLDKAEASIREALRLEPQDADAYSVLSRIFLARDRYQEALDAARQGLGVDPDHIDCGNMQSISLERLGRGDEAIFAAGETLRRDPDDPNSHAAHGLTLLNARRYVESQYAFREALRLDPQNEMARRGMISALNSRSFVFRCVHRFYVALSRLNSKAAFALIFGAWILMQVLSYLADQIPALSPVITPILILYVLFVVLTWIANPLFNSFLRFHAFGQHLLDRSQRWASNLIAPCVALSIFGLGIGAYHQDFILALIVAGYWIAMAIPIAAVFAMPTRGRRMLVAAAAVVIGLLPVIGIVRSIRSDSLAPLGDSLTHFAISLLAIQIVGTLIAVTPVRR